MDGILSLYIVATLILLTILFLGWKENPNISKWALTVAAIAHLCVLVGIKNEGAMAALIILFCLLLSLIVDKIRINIPKLLLVFLPGFIVSAIWLLLSYRYGIVNDLAASGNFMGAFTSRLMDASSLSLIVIALYYKTWSVFLLLIIGLIYIYQFNQATIKAASLRFWM